MVVQGTNVAHLLELQALAMSLSLPTYLVQDAGLTQVRETNIFSSGLVLVIIRLSSNCCLIKVDDVMLVYKSSNISVITTIAFSFAQCLGMKIFVKISFK